MSDLITQKLEELEALAQVEGEPSVQIIALAILGARNSDDCDLLAAKVKEFLRDVLIPRVQEKQIKSIISQN